MIESKAAGWGVAEWLSRTESNNSLNRSGISLNVIENLDAIRCCFPPGQFGR
ncbi:MAG TPA: hypothetical protein VFQ47_02730 [Nitrososphaera sp.]|nr:hypothetical protein [Nitrososphaera sp.]